MDRPTDAFAAAVKAAVAAQGVNLSATATDALVRAMDADESVWFLSRYVDEPNADLVANRVKMYLTAKPPKPEERAGEHASTFGVPPEVWNDMRAVDRLTLARKAGGAVQNKPASKSFPERRIESDLHASRLRLHSLSGEERQKQAARIAALEAELAEARAR